MISDYLKRSNLTYWNSAKENLVDYGYSKAGFNWIPVCHFFELTYKIL